jgi:hypothetical protein
MDAFEMTRPVLASTTFFTRRSLRPAAPTFDATASLVEARRYVNQLPLGRSPGRGRRPLESAAGARREIERALWRTAAAHGVSVATAESSSELARRLVRSHVIVTPAADAVAALLPVLDAGVGADGVHLAQRLVGYLDHRAATRR